MPLNTELFQKIDDIIQVFPGAFHMGTWEGTSPSGCGTTRCIAGWAVYFALEEQDLFESPDSPFPSEALIRLAERHDARTGSGVDFDKLGRELLGLEAGQGYLFYVDNERAVQLVALAADGDEEAFTRELDR